MTRYLPPEDRVFVGLATAVFFLGLLTATLVHPLLRIPDEPFHADMALVASDPVEVVAGHGWPLVQDRRLQAALVDASLHRGRRMAHTHPGVRGHGGHDHAVEGGGGFPRTSSSAPDRRSRHPLARWLGGSAKGPPSRMAQHPPLYYTTVGLGAEVLDALEPGALAYDVQLWLMRLIGVILLLPVPAVTYLIARELTDRRGPRLGAAVLPLGVPGLLARTGPMINNDVLMVTLGAVLTWLIVRIVAGRAGTGTALAAGGVAGLSMITKAFGLVLLGALGLAYLYRLVVALPRRGPAWRIIRHGAVAAGTAAVVGGWWFVRNLVRFGALREAGVIRETAAGFSPDWSFWAQQILWKNWSSFWGGWQGVAIWNNPNLLLGLIAVMVAGIVLALVRLRDARALTVAALLPGLALTASLYLFLAMTYPETGRIGGFAGRYQYAGLSGLLAVMAVGLGSAWDRLERFFPLIATVGAGLVGAYSLYVWLTIEWGGRSAGIVDRVRGVLAWAPVDPLVAVGTVALLGVSGLALLAAAVRTSVGAAGREVSGQTGYQGT